MYFSHLFKIPSMGPSPKAQPKKSRNYRRKCAKKEGRDCTVEQEKGVNKSIKEEPTFRQVEDREKEESISQIEWTQDGFLNLEQSERKKDGEGEGKES
eukprot:CAMPEP_0197002512 /NCGR_PEP_ID=MMETSP1380-20130617/6994_1 /TAXON_ID=5936 /ORGANISM="Euplotes crassus, Strain CT5" /LENGTH=97 /DNA_ID=CAMNT_0042420663 /DNA_START=684 /DNA_END=980 /DNA_ORIENTATION=-